MLVKLLLTHSDFFFFSAGFLPAEPFFANLILYKNQFLAIYKVCDFAFLYFVSSL